jgi:hypothetical protein
VSDLKGYDELVARIHAIADNRKVMGIVASLAAGEAKKLAPVQTGNLRRTIRVGTVTEDSAEIIAGANYAQFVELGTRGGTIIRPVRAKVLAWGGPRRLSGSLRKGAKATNFAMRVRRGATRAQPFLLPGARAAVQKSGFIEGLVKAWNEAA